MLTLHHEYLLAGNVLLGANILDSDPVVNSVLAYSCWALLAQFLMAWPKLQAFSIILM